MFVEETSKQLGLSVDELLLFAASCPRRYKVYRIPKKRGGYRTIAQPSRTLKAIQNVVMRKNFGKLPVHRTATAYREGSGIRRNAAIHKENQYLLKMDFANFFPSIRPDDFVLHLEKHFGAKVSAADVSFLSGLFFYREKSGADLVMSIGAPTSPAISNTLLYEFDEIIATTCEQQRVLYTRYADDLTFSSNKPKLLSTLPMIVEDVLAGLSYPHLRVNTDKTIHLSKKGRRQITGLVITNEGNLSIGRERKRLIKSLVHRFACGELSTENLSRLRGLLWFVNDVEPSFLESLKKKYGPSVISQIQRTA